MPETVKQKLGFLVAAMMMVAALAVLNIGSPAGAQSKPCKSGGGGNQTSSPSPSPTESEEPFPPSLPPIIPEETESESPSPTESTGGARNCSSEISLKYKGNTFSGSVKSQEDECEVGRKVVLKKKKKGRDRTIETTVTNNKGSYEMPVKAKGKHYTQTPKEKVAAEDGPVNCGAAKSDTVKV
jgi:hypothetical protein